MLKKITNGLVAIINDAKITEISKKSVVDFASMVINKDPVSLALSLDDTKKFYGKFPTQYFGINASLYDWYLFQKN